MSLKGNVPPTIVSRVPSLHFLFFLPYAFSRDLYFGPSFGLESEEIGIVLLIFFFFGQYCPFFYLGLTRVSSWKFRPFFPPFQVKEAGPIHPPFDK